MARGRSRKKLKKAAKNVYLEERQIKYILKKCDESTKFSLYLRDIVDLYIALAEEKIVEKLDAESINQFKRTILDERTRSAFIKMKVSEYKEIFEDLVKHSRHFLPDVTIFSDTLIFLGDFFSQINLENMQKNPNLEAVLTKIPMTSNMITSIEANIEKGNHYVQLTGDLPFTLLWYAKMLASALSVSKYHWKIEHTIPEKLVPLENVKKIRLYLTESKTLQEARQRIFDTFSRLEMRIIDTAKLGVWEMLNNPFHIIADREFLNYLHGNSEEIPYKMYIDEIGAMNKTKVEKGSLVLGFYNKINLIINLETSKNSAIFTPFYPIVIDLIKSTFTYLQISFTLKQHDSNVILTLDSLYP